MSDLATLVRGALAEDVGGGDVTTRALVGPALKGRAQIVAKASGVVAGIDAMSETYRQVDATLAIDVRVFDGDAVARGDVVATIEGSFAALLIAERTALNFLQRLSGVATMTRRFVAAVARSEATIVDTRKTTPGWRHLEKAAVLAGGGGNHRSGLFDAFLIKENHVVAAGGIEAALASAAAANRADLPVEIEVRDAGEIEAALASSHRPDRIMCDNFKLRDLAAAVRRIRRVDPGIVVEASGGVSLQSAAAIAATGVDWISVGALTHSAPALDLSCLIERA